jgi:hypothetical protein
MVNGKISETVPTLPAKTAHHLFVDRTIRPQITLRQGCGKSPEFVAVLPEFVAGFPEFVAGSPEFVAGKGGKALISQAISPLNTKNTIRTNKNTT